MDEKSDAQVLAEAREYLEENGWYQNDLLGSDGSVCALGALVVSQDWLLGTEIDSAYMIDVDRLSTKLMAGTSWSNADRYPAPSWRLTAWNDRICESQQEVLDLFAKAEKIELAGFDPDAA